NVSIAGSTISRNIAENGAQFIEVQNGSIIAEVAANTYGGGIDDEFDLGFSLTFPPPVTTSLSITNSTLNDNVALGNGGSAFAFGGGLNATLVNAQVTNSMVSGNEAIGSPGGGFFSFGGTTFPQSGGIAVGGGLYGVLGSLTVSGSTVKDNLAQGGPG